MANLVRVIEQKKPYAVRAALAKKKYKDKFPYFKPGDTCPRCQEVMNDDSEYVDVGVGSVKVTYLMCCPRCWLQGCNAGQDIMWFEDTPEGTIDWDGKKLSEEELDLGRF